MAAWMSRGTAISSWGVADGMTCAALDGVDDTAPEGMVVALGVRRTDVVAVVVLPEPDVRLVVVVDVVVDELVVTAGLVVVVVVDEVCAKAAVSAIALTAPAANSVINLFCFMFVLCFG